MSDTAIPEPSSAARTSSADAALAVASQLADALGRTAIERDRAGGHAAEQRELIRRSGLLNLTTPLEFGGQGQPWSLFFRTLRCLAQADSALAHVYAFHHLQIATILLYGSPEQHAALLPATVAQNRFWGNALNPNDKRAQCKAHQRGFFVDGPKSYCSGSVGSDWMTFSAWDPASQGLLIGVVPCDRAGVHIQSDWDMFGQKQTDSGTVRFEQVSIADAEVLVRPGAVLTPRATLRSQLAQLVLTNLYAGLANGALEEGLRYTREHSRPFFASGVERAVDDPYVQQRYGGLALQASAAQTLADMAAERIDAALARGDALSADERGEVAIAVAQAKVLAHRAAIDVCGQIFELTGPGATANQWGLDRYWRNARVHTLHDPVDYKLRDLGRHALFGRYPEPSSYS